MRQAHGAGAPGRRRIAGAAAWALFSSTLVSAPAPARAMSGPDLSVVIVGAIAGGLDLGFATYDLALAERGKKPSYLGAVIETSLMTIQLASGLSMFLSSVSNRDYGFSASQDLALPVGGLMAAFGFTLMLHGIWGLRHADLHADLLRVVPGPVTDGKSVAWGLHAVGRF